MATETKSEVVYGALADGQLLPVEIQAKTGLTRALINYHLKTLKKSGRIKQRGARGPYFIPEAKGAPASQTLPGIEPPAGAPTTPAERVREILRSNGSAMSLREIREGLTDLKAPTISQILKRMVRLGVVKKSADGWLFMQGTENVALPKVRQQYKKRAELLPAIAAPRGHHPPAASARNIRDAMPVGFSARQVQSMILRMENANEYNAFFTPLDFDVLEGLLKVAR